MVGFSDDDPTDTQDWTRMHLSGPILTPAQIAAAAYQVFTTKTVNGVTVVGGATGGTVTRAAGDWLADGFIVGQRIQLDGVAGSWQLDAITNGEQDARALRRSGAAERRRARRGRSPRSCAR